MSKTESKSSKPILTYAFQAIAAIFLLMAAYMKFSDHADSILIFTHLDMEPFGRYLIATIELCAGLLLLSPYSALGSVVSVGVMLGALIAHITELGFVVHDDGGKLFMMMLAVLASSVFVMVSRREEIPLVGETL